MTGRSKSHMDTSEKIGALPVVCVDAGPEKSDWLKVAEWLRTFSQEERQLLKSFKGCDSDLCSRAWLAQRQYRLSHGKWGMEILTDPDLHKALLLVRAAGIPCDRMHPDDEELRGYMKEPVS